MIFQEILKNAKENQWNEEEEIGTDHDRRWIETEFDVVGTTSVSSVVVSTSEYVSTRYVRACFYSSRLFYKPKVLRKINDMNRKESERIAPADG